MAVFVGSTIERRSREKNWNRLPGFVAFSIAARFNSFWHPVDNLFGFSFPNEKLVAQGRTGRRVTIIFTWKKFSSYKRGLFYHLHPQTGRFTVWVNGKQNSALINFATESR